VSQRLDEKLEAKTEENACLAKNADVFPLKYAGIYTFATIR
jgi:hypothetical protein